MNENGSGGQNGGSSMGTNPNGDGTSEKSRHGINNNRFDGKRSNGMIHSDGDDDDDDDDIDDIDDDDDDNSPTSHQGRNSVESTSEQSLTSPAGFSSLPSIGSPAGSIASPSTPGGYENRPGSVTSSAGSMLGGPPDPSYWYSRPPGAFKPPAPASAVNGNMNMFQHHPSFQHAHHLQALQQYQQQLAAGALLHRPPVGTDPRDSKNPLSISQLTGSHTTSSTASAMANGLSRLDNAADLKLKSSTKNFFSEENRII